MKCRLPLPPPRDRSLWLFVALLTGVAAAVRSLAAARDDLWFDEIWSWWIARGLFPTRLIDNNHPLNTLWMSLLPDTAPALAFRGLSLVSGALSIPLAALVARRWGRLHALATAAVMTVAYPLILYQSEARGYAPMLAALLAVLWLSLRHVDRPTPRGPLWVLGVVAVGIGSHLGFVVGYAAVILMTAIVAEERRRRGDQRKKLHLRLVGTADMADATPTRVRATLLRLHAVPVLLCGVAYLGFYRRMDTGGGPIVSTSEALTATGGQLIGVPVGLGAGALVLMGLAGLFAWRRGKMDVLALLGFALTAVLIIAWKQRGDVLYVRYFLPAMLLAWLAFGWCIGELGRRKPALAAATWSAWAALQLSPILDLLTIGRADHAGALGYIARQAEGVPFVLGTDQPNRTGVLVEFYRRRLSSGHDLTLLPEGAPLTQADWLILGPRPSFPQTYHTAEGALFERQAIFPTCNNGVQGSGWAWQVYRRTDLPSLVSIPGE